MKQLKKVTQRDRYGNQVTMEYEVDRKALDPTALMSKQMEVPEMGEPPMDHPGEPRGSDTVPAWLTPGEFVVNAEAMRIPGAAEQVQQINDMGRAVQQAQGGSIGHYSDGGIQPVPGLSNPETDLGGVYRADGGWTEYALDAAEMLPVFGQGVTVGRKAMKYLPKAMKAGRKAGKQLGDLHGQMDRSEDFDEYLDMLEEQRIQQMIHQQQRSKDRYMGLYPEDYEPEVLYRADGGGDVSYEDSWMLNKILKPKMQNLVDRARSEGIGVEHTYSPQTHSAYNIPHAPSQGQWRAASNYAEPTDGGNYVHSNLRMNVPLTPSMANAYVMGEEYAHARNKLDNPDSGVAVGDRIGLLNEMLKNKYIAKDRVIEEARAKQAAQNFVGGLSPDVTDFHNTSLGGYMMANKQRYPKGAQHASISDVVSGMQQGTIDAAAYGFAEGGYLPAGDFMDNPMMVPPPPEVEAEMRVPNLRGFESLGDLLAEREGFRDEIYLDSLGKPTVGYGRLIEDAVWDPNDPRIGTKPYSVEQLNQFKQDDMATAEAAARRNLGEEHWGKLTPEQQWALTSQAFQLGGAGQAKFKKQLQAIRDGDYAEAARQAYDSKWFKQTPKRTHDLAAAFDPSVMAEYKSIGGAIKWLGKKFGMEVPDPTQVLPAGEGSDQIPLDENGRPIYGPETMPVNNLDWLDETQYEEDYNMKPQYRAPGGWLSRLFSPNDMSGRNDPVDEFGLGSGIPRDVAGVVRPSAPVDPIAGQVPYNDAALRDLRIGPRTAPFSPETGLPMYSAAPLPADVTPPPAPAPVPDAMDDPFSTGADVTVNPEETPINRLDLTTAPTSTYDIGDVGLETYDAPGLPEDQRGGGGLDQSELVHNPWEDPSVMKAREEEINAAMKERRAEDAINEFRRNNPYSRKSDQEILDDVAESVPEVKETPPPEAEKPETTQQMAAAITDEQRRAGGALPDAEAIEAAKGVVEQDPSALNKMTSWFMDNLRDTGLLNDKQLKRAAFLYLGQRAMGYSHAGSLNWTAKNYLSGIQNQESNYMKVASSGKYSKESLAKFKESGDPADLSPIAVAPKRVTAKPQVFYDNQGKKHNAFEYEDSAGNKFLGNAQGQPFNTDALHQDAWRVKGTKEHGQRIMDYKREATTLLKDLQKAQGTIRNEDGTTRTVTDMVPSAAAGDAAKWAVENGIPPERTSGIFQNAYSDMLNYAKTSGKRPKSIRPFLNQMVIRESVAQPDMFLAKGQGEEGEPQRFVDADKLALVNRAIARQSGVDSSRASDIANQYYNRVMEVWMNDLTQEERDKYNNMANDNENGFYVYVAERLGMDDRQGNNN